MVAPACRARKLLTAYPELAAVLVAAILGLSIQRPFAWLTAHQGINALLALLVFATAVTIEPAALRRLTSAWRRLALALVTGITVLPALSWAVAQIIGPGPLRDGVLAVGLAPCEIASVATTALAGGEAAVAAGVLIGSTLTTVALAGPILTLEAGHARVSPAGIIANLALVVALPLALGLAARASAGLAPRASAELAHRASADLASRAFADVAPRAVPSGPAVPSGSAESRKPRLLASTRVLSTARAEAVASLVALITVAALVALIAAEIRLSAAYVSVAAALLMFLFASALLGRALGRRAARPSATALLLTTSMRDFAIAAGLAAAAFGPAAAAPLGLYGVAVLVWGTAVAGVLRQRGGHRPEIQHQSELTDRCFAQQASSLSAAAQPNQLPPVNLDPC